MKKLFLLFICSAFSVIINAQTFFADNATDQVLNVTAIGKFNSICLSSPDCSLSSITGLVSPSNPTGSLSYPSSCTNDNIMMTVALQGSTFVASIYYCGTGVTWVPNNVNGGGGPIFYDLTAVAGGVKLKFHY
jgi:hypothetical protein